MAENAEYRYLKYKCKKTLKNGEVKTYELNMKVKPYKKENYSEEDKKEIVRLYKIGLSLNKLGKNYNTSAYKIKQIIEEAKENEEEVNVNKEETQ